MNAAQRMLKRIRVEWQRSFVTRLLFEFPFLLWGRGSGRGGPLFRNLCAMGPGTKAQLTRVLFGTSTLLCLAVSNCRVAGCAKKSAEGEAQEKSPQSRVNRGTNGEVTITLDAAAQKTIGLTLTQLVAAQFAPELKAYGRVLDPLPLVSQITDLAAAQVTAQASQSELQRLQTLAGQNNASQRAVQAAEAAAARDQLQLQSGRLRLIGTWGTAIVQPPDLP